MRLALVLTSEYGDLHAEDWQPELRYTASFLRRNGVPTEVVYRPTLEAFDGAFGLGAGMLYLELTEENGPAALAALHGADVAGAFVVVGGPYPSARARALLESCPTVDYVVVGERELPLLGLFERLARGLPTNDVPGLAGRWFANPPDPPVGDLDQLGPLVLDGLEDVLAGRALEERVGYLSSSRGCYARCSFCGVPGFSRLNPGSAWRGRSSRFVVDEMERIGAELEISRFVFRDDNFIGPGRLGHRRAIDIAHTIQERRLDIRFSLCCRVTDVRYDTLAPLVDAGLQRLGMSIESYNDESLELLQKGSTVARVEQAFALIERLPLTAEVNLIFFDPSLTLDGVRNNLALLERIRTSEHLVYSDAFPFNELQVFPWAPIGRRLHDRGMLDGDGRQPRYRDPYVGELVRFVRRLRDLLPLAFKRRLLFDSLQNGGGAPTAAGIDLLRVADGLRSWVGLVVSPRYVAEACDVLERAREPSLASEALDGLVAQFAEEVAVLSRIEHGMEAMLLDAAGQRSG